MRDVDALLIAVALLLGIGIGCLCCTPTHDCQDAPTYTAPAPYPDHLPTMGQE